MSYLQHGARSFITDYEINTFLNPMPLSTKKALAISHPPLIDYLAIVNNLSPEGTSQKLGGGLSSNETMPCQYGPDPQGNGVEGGR
jgi:hypothetical protein